MNWPEVKAWRRAARRILLTARAAIAVSVREDMSRRLIDRLRPILKDRPQPISFYWPIKAEPDLKPLMQELDAAGVAVCLPVAIELGEPLRFRPWRKGAKLERGFWGIPVPADPTEVAPRTLIAPIVGYDDAGYRLGYGGGFFDRTLAGFGENAAAIGIGFDLFHLPTIQPQPHDIRMELMVTERRVLRRASAPQSEVCYLKEADVVYAGFATKPEIAGVLGQLRPIVPPERIGLLDYAAWQLGETASVVDDDAIASAEAALDVLLPRIRDDAIHDTLTALRASLATARPDLSAPPPDPR